MLLKLQSLLKRRYVRFAAQAGLLVLVYLAIKMYMQRDLVEGRLPLLEGTLLGGGEFSSRSLPGKTRLIHFWATWCSICRLEEGSIDAISKDHEIITIAMKSGNKQAIAAYLKQREIHFPVLVDEDGSIAGRFGVRGVPTTFVIDAGGEIRFVEVGYTTELGLRLRLWLVALF